MFSIFTTFTSLKSEAVLYIIHLWFLVRKLVLLVCSTFGAKKNKSRNIRNVRKELYNPLLEASKNHIALTIPEPLIAKKKKIQVLRNFSILNQKFSPKKESPKEKPEFFKTLPNEPAKEKAEFFQSLPHEPKGSVFELPQGKMIPITIKKNLNKLGFLPSTLIRLADFHKLNEEFIVKCRKFIVHEDFLTKVAKYTKKDDITFHDIFELYAKRKCFEKKCCCAKGNNRFMISGKTKFGFKPTMLTPIIENVIYK